MDKLQQEIEVSRSQVAEAEKAVKVADKRVAEARRVLEIRKAELSAFERAAALRPIQDSESQGIAAANGLNGEHPARRGGRQPGAISFGWRKVLASIVESENSLTSVTGLCLLAESHKLPHDPRSVRERFRKFVRLGHAEEQDGKYRVTESAIRRFDLAKNKAPTALSVGASNGSGVSSSGESAGSAR